MKIPHWTKQYTDPADIEFATIIPFVLGQPVWPSWFEMVDGGAITFVDGSGGQVTFDDVAPGKVYAAEIREIVEADGRVRVGSDPASITAPAGPPGPAGDRIIAKWAKTAADGSAAAETTATGFFTNLGSTSLTVTGAAWVSDAALTANDTNFKTITCELYDDDGVLVGTVASVTTETTGSGNWTAHKKVTLTLGAELEVPPNYSLTFKITKTASGVVVPIGYGQVEMSPAG